MANVTVNKHNNMLIIGKGATNNSRKQIVFAEKYKDVYNAFGDSELTDAFITVKKLGAPYVFLMNCRQNYDYFDISTTLRATDFTYVVPISLMISDEFDDPKTERRISYIEYLLEQVGSVNDSVFIVTDKSASLYEDIDAFIEDMNKISSNFSKKRKSPAVRENIIFVANNLIDYKISSLPLAAALCTTPINQYPTTDFGEAYFLLDQWEDIGNWAYFQNHTVRGTTVENLLNFETVGNPLKIVFISRIIKLLKRELDFHDFVGKQYTEYRRLSVRTRLEEYLESLLNSVLYEYEIKAVKPYKHISEPLSIDIRNVFDVLPINCLEKVTISNKIEVS